MHNDFFSTVGEILKYGGTTFAALITGCLYTATDGFFIGQYVGHDGLGAMALVFPVTMVFTALGTIFEIGGSALVSEKIGAGNRKAAEQIMRTNYIGALVIGIFFAIFGNWILEPLLRLLADNPNEHQIIDMAVSFLRISLCGVPFLLVGLLTQSFMRCVEQPLHVIYLVAATTLTNVFLDALFIIVFGWGMTGAAVATLIAQVLGAAISLWYFKYSKQKFSSRWSIVGADYLWKECKIGAGFATSDFMMCFIGYFLNIVLFQWNSSHLLASVAMMNVISSFVYLSLYGLDTGTQPLVSRLFATGNKVRCLRVMRYNFTITAFLTLTMYAVLMIFMAELADFFITDNEPITAEMIAFLRMTFVCLPFIGLFTWFSGIMVSLGDEWRNFVVSCLPLIVQVPLIWLLPKFLPPEYIALNYAALDIAEALLAFLLIRSFLRHKGLSLRKIFS